MQTLTTFILTAAAALMLSAAPALAHGHGKGHHAAEKGTTLVGEVMDLACYMQHPEDGQGPGHAACARQCVNKGLGVGLKVGNTLYVILGPGHENVTEKVAAFAGKQAKVTGKVIERDGMKAFVVQSIEAAGG